MTQHVLFRRDPEGSARSGCLRRRATGTGPAANRRRRLRWCGLALATVTALACGRTTLADSIYWQETTGSWGDASNWNDQSPYIGQPGYPNVVPGGSDYAYIANGGTATVDASGTASWVLIDQASSLVQLSTLTLTLTFALSLGNTPGPAAVTACKAESCRHPTSISATPGPGPSPRPAARTTSALARSV